MNVLFDISALALTRGSKMGMRGIHRVVENVLETLAPRCQLSLSSAENPFLAGDYLRSRPSLNQIPFLTSPFQERLGRYTSSTDNYRLRNTSDVHTDRRISRKISRWASARIADGFQELISKTTRYDLRKFDIFHQPGRFEIPQSVKNHRRGGFARFMTIYDFIPFSPEGFATWDAPVLHKVLKTLSKDDFLICISEHVKAEACESLNFPEAQVFVIPLAASREVFHPCLDRDRVTQVRRKLNLGNLPYFLSLSAIDPRKNVLTLIKAFAALCHQQPSMNAQLVLAGSVSQADAIQLASHSRSLGVEHRVIMPGYVPDDCLAPLYSDALAFVFPSLAEGFGLPPLEAMQCGSPVICSSLTSLPEVMGDAGILVDPRDEDSLAGAMWRLFDDPDERAALSRLGIERAEGFSWENCATQHVDAYSKALGK